MLETPETRMPKTLNLYGIPSCDTCRQARKWLDENDIAYDFHDVRSEGLDAQMLERWSKRLGWEKLLNKQSLTWRKVPQVDRDNMNKSRALLTMIEHPTLLKRPVLESTKMMAVGFSPDRYEEIFAKR
jgi:arsenate reductase